MTAEEISSPVDDGPDPRNVGTVREWDADRQRHVDVTRNYEERAAFGGTLTVDSTMRFVEGARQFPPGSFTVGEIRRRGLRDVQVICPRVVVSGTFRVAVPGHVLTWAQAVAYGIVEEG